MSFSQSGPTVNPGAMGLYNQQLGLNLQNYNTILNSYNQAQGNAANELQGIYSGYGALSKSVLGALGVNGGGWGVAAPAAQQIQKQFVQSQGQNKQQLINAGLGNSTVLSNAMTAGNEQASLAYGSLGAQLAQTAAGYESQIGLAGLSAQQQGLSQQLGLTSNLMGDISHYNFSPNVNLYGQSSYSAQPNSGGGGGYGAGGTTPQGSQANQADYDTFGAFNQSNAYSSIPGYSYGGGGGGYGQPTYLGDPGLAESGGVTGGGDWGDTDEE
jgi:hypothetical protein